MKKIAFLLFCGKSFGGMERRYARLFEYLSSSRSDVYLLCTNDAIDGMSSIGVSPPVGHVRLIDFRINSNGTLFVKKINRIIGLIRALFILAIEGYESVHIISGPGIIPYFYSKFSWILPRFSFSAVDSNLSNYDLNKIDYLVKRSCAVDCLSNSIAEHIRSPIINDADRNKIHVSPCSFTDYGQVKDAVIRDIDVLMLARFVPGKGYDLLAEATHLIERGLNIHLCGFGPNIPSVAGAAVYEATDSFDVLSRSKIFLSLQSAENYPSQSLLEAMASGCAIIATDVGETRRILDESCAVLIAPDPRELACVIQELISDPVRCAALGDAAKRRVLEEHVISRFAAYFERYILGT